MTDCVANSSPPWAAYRALINCCLVALDKRPGVRPVRIGETLRWALAKLVMRAAGEQEKTECGNMQLCAVLEDGKEVATNAVGQCQLERVRRRQNEDKVGTAEGEEESQGVAGILNNLNIETGRNKEEAAESLKVPLGMEFERDGEDYGASK